jgi:hypothetical protein
VASKDSVEQTGPSAACFMAWAKDEGARMTPALASWASSDASRLAMWLPQWAGPSLMEAKALEWAQMAPSPTSKQKADTGSMIEAWAAERVWGASWSEPEWLQTWSKASRACLVLALALGGQGIDAAESKAAKAIEGAIRRPSRGSIAAARAWLGAGVDPSCADELFEFEGGSALSAALAKASRWPMVGLLLEAGARIDPKDRALAAQRMSDTLAAGGRERSRARVAVALATRLAGSPNAYRGRGGRRLFDLAARAAQEFQPLAAPRALARLGVEAGPLAARALLRGALANSVLCEQSGVNALAFMKELVPSMLHGWGEKSIFWLPLARALRKSKDPAELARWAPEVAKWASSAAWSVDDCRQVGLCWPALQGAGLVALVDAQKQARQLDAATAPAPQAPKRRL